MAKSDKTGKPDQKKAEEKSVDDIVEAEIVEEIADDEAKAQSESDVSLDDADLGAEDSDTEVELKEPDSADESAADESAAEEAPAEDAALEDASEDEDDNAETEAEVVDDVTAEEPTPPAQPEPQPVTQEVQKVGFVQLVLGGVVAAGLGFGLATYLTSEGMMPVGGSSAAVEELKSKLAGQETLIADLKTSQEQFSTQLSEAVANAAGGAEASSQISEIAARLDEMALLIVTLEDRVVTAEKRPMTEGASAAAIDAYEREVADLRAMVADQLAEAASLKENSERSAQQTLARAALARIISGLDSGAPYRAALTDLSGVSGVAIPAELEANADTGVPTLLVLVESYPDAAREALADARALEASEGGNSLTGFFKKQLGARSVTPKEGDDADAILSRAEAAVKEGRVQDALTELQQLPESSQALMAEWRKMAETRIAAQNAVESLSSSLTQN